MTSGQRVKAHGRSHSARPGGREARAAGLTILAGCGKKTACGPMEMLAFRTLGKRWPLSLTSLPAGETRVREQAAEIPFFRSLMVLGAAAILAAAPVWAQTWAQPSDSAAWAQKRRSPAPADISDCSQWATAASGFNPGANKLPPAWDKPKPRSISAEARYNRSMGACLGQREPPAR